MQEIERKFLVKVLPSLDAFPSTVYERYFLVIKPDYEERIQKKGEIFEKEIKRKTSELTRITEKKTISREEFEKLKETASYKISRISYFLEPNLTIKVYLGDYEGLVRAEIEFDSEIDAKNFIPLDWMGQEITNTKLGKDSKLVKLNQKEFLSLIKEYS